LLCGGSALATVNVIMRERTMKAFRLCTLIVAAVCLTAPVVFGQRMMGGARDFGGAQMAKIFGKNEAFTATAD